MMHLLPHSAITHTAAAAAAAVAPGHRHMHPLDLDLDLDLPDEAPNPALLYCVYVEKSKFISDADACKAHTQACYLSK